MKKLGKGNCYIHAPTAFRPKLGRLYTKLLLRNSSIKLSKYINDSIKKIKIKKVIKVSNAIIVIKLHSNK